MNGRQARSVRREAVRVLGDRSASVVGELREAVAQLQELARVLANQQAHLNARHERLVQMVNGLTDTVTALCHAHQTRLDVLWNERDGRRAGEVSDASD